MSSVVDTLFGGTDKSAQRAQTQANQRAVDLIAERSAEARGDVLNLFPASDTNRNLGFQAALDVLGETIPQQFSAFQQGNVGAQGALLAGLPQFQNAILGLPTDFSGFQPQTIDFNTGFAQQQLPEFISSTTALAPEEVANPLAGRPPGRPGGFRFGGGR
jgi:hypothetical protein